MYFTALEISHFQEYKIINLPSNCSFSSAIVYVYFGNKQNMLILYYTYTGGKYNHKRKQNKYYVHIILV